MCNVWGKQLGRRGTTMVRQLCEPWRYRQVNQSPSFSTLRYPLDQLRDAFDPALTVVPPRSFGGGKYEALAYPGS